MKLGTIASLGLLSVAQALPKITRTGKYLYNPEGNRFFIKVRRGDPDTGDSTRGPRGSRGVLCQASVQPLTSRVWHINLKENSPRRAMPTLQSEHRVTVVRQAIANGSGGFPEPSSYIDPLSSSQNCTRDLPYLRQLGVNAVRVYSIDPAKDHSDCMKAFDDAGIYVLYVVASSCLFDISPRFFATQECPLPPRLPRSHLKTDRSLDPR